MFLRELFEAPKKVAVAAFGRMNPPTIGHEKLVEKVKSYEGDHYIFLSQTVKPKDNPLPFDVKLEFAKKFFPGVNVGHPSVRTPIQMLQMLEKLGYTDIIYVAGSDRVASFDKLFNDYNGKEYNFNSITVENAGERDPDADGAEGMSASKMRAAAASGDYEAFAQGVPKPALAEKLYDAVRNGMGVKDKEPAEGLEEKKDDLKGFTSDTLKALMQLKRKYPHADSDLAALLAAVGDNKELIGTTDFENDLEAADLAQRLDKLEKIVKKLQKSKPKEGLDEQQLNEAFPLLIPALAAAVRIGAPAVARMLTSQGAKQAAKVVAKNTGNVAKATGKAVIKNPGKTALAVGGYEVYDTVSDAIDWLKELDVAEELIKPLAQAMIKYALPVAAVLAILYGGKKLYDYIQDNPDDKQPANEILGFATKSPKRNVVKRRPPEPEEDSVQDKLKKRRAMKSKGNPDAFKTGAVK